MRHSNFCESAGLHPIAVRSYASAPITDLPLHGKKLISRPLKIFRLTRHPNQTYNSRHPVPRRGALANVTNVGAGCGGRGSVGRESVFAGRFFRERATSRRRTALKRLGRNFFRQHAGRLERMARGSCGRQNRVVLAPVAGVKPMEIVGPDRASIDRQSVGDGGQRNSAPGRSRHKP